MLVGSKKCVFGIRLTVEEANVGRHVAGRVFVEMKLNRMASTFVIHTMSRRGMEGAINIKILEGACSLYGSQ